MKKFLLLISLILLASSCGGDSSSDDFLDGVLDDEHRIFITSQSFNGDLGGISGADSKCASAASSAGLERSYKAVISDSTANASVRLSLNGAIYVFDSNDSKVEIASVSSFWDTASQSLSQAVVFDESGASLSAVGAWSGGDSEGVYQGGFSNACSDWTSSLNGDSGDYGVNNFVDSRWLESTNAACDSTKRIYCISQ